MCQNSKPRVTVALSQHRPEAVRPAAALMAKHAAIFLEEPPSDALNRMLTGDLHVDDYLQLLDTEYPEFSQRMAIALKQLFASGKHILAVEPFLGHLLDIHELFADGGAPADLDPASERYRVYTAERDATGALLAFYEAAAQASFENIVATVIRFARQDARRFVLRDKLRARALARQVPEYTTSFVEAGQMHYFLWRRLHRALGRGYAVKPRFLIAPAAAPVNVQRLYGPGDILTLLYIFHPTFRGPRADLLAARSLIYNQLIEKNEMVPAGKEYPHAANELEILARVRHLSFADCRKLYARIRPKGASSAI